MTANLDINQARSRADINAVQALFAEYLQVLGNDYGLKTNSCGKTCNTGNTEPTYKALFLAKLDGVAVAACGLIHINEKDCELVRLYCKPQGRGHGLGGKLCAAVGAYAKAQNYDRLVLSTEPIMKHAVRLYRSIGFVDIPNYANAPSACSKYMALELKR